LANRSVFGRLPRCWICSRSAITAPTALRLTAPFVLVVWSPPCIVSSPTTPRLENELWMGRASLPQRSPRSLSNHARAPADQCHLRGGSLCGTRRAIGDEGNAYTAEFQKQPAQRVATRKPFAPLSRRARPPQRCTRERSSPRQCRIRAVPRSETPRWVTPPVPGLGGSRATTETPSLSHARRRDTTQHPPVANQPTGKPEVASMPLPL